ncbi:MAG: tripartite tricarboxylate transporter substrate binding protein [Gammaproteobacteria bacterium]
MGRLRALQIEATLAMGLLVSGHAAAAYPTRPIDLYIGSAPSGSTDVLGRVLARSLEQEIGQPVVVHNVPGAGGAVMATQLKNSAPDGYSLGMTISHAYTGNPVVMPEVTPYDVDDFSHLASVSKGQCALVTSTAKPYRTFGDLIAAAHAGERPIFASQSPLSRIVADYVAGVEGIEFRVITVQGGGEIMQNILGGHADFGFSGGPHINYVAAGQMRVLASVEDARLLTSPEVPTLRELGYDITSCSTFVVSAPPALPEDIKTKLSEALRRAIASPEMKTLIRNLRYPEYYLGPEDVTHALQTEADMLARAVARIESAEREGRSRELSSAFMPWVAAAIGGLALAGMLIGRLRHDAAPAEPATAHAAALQGDAGVFIAAAIVVMAAGFGTMAVFGYLAGAAATVAGFLLLGRANWIVVIGGAAVLPLLLWLLFSKLLGFPLP